VRNLWIREPFMEHQSEIDTQKLPGAGDETVFMPLANESENKPRPSQRSKELILQIILVALGMFLLYVIGFFYDSELREIYRKNLRPAILAYWLNVLAVLLVLVLGFNLYLFRSYRRFYFGLSEVIVGLVVSWYGATIARDVSIRDGLLLGVAALYLVGSGFRNLSKTVDAIRVESEDK